MAMSSTCYNPFLYGWYNESFQKEFVQFSPLLRFICGSGASARQAAAGEDLPLRTIHQVPILPKVTNIGLQLSNIWNLHILHFCCLLFNQYSLVGKVFFNHFSAIGMFYQETSGNP
jgi:hypothetical protein